MSSRILSFIISLLAVVLIAFLIGGSSDSDKPTPSNKTSYSFEVGKLSLPTSTPSSPSPSSPSSPSLPSSPETPSLFEELIEDIPDSFSPSTIINPSSEPKTPPSPPSPPSLPPSLPSPPISISEEDIFNHLWPQNYLDYLSYLQDFLIDYGHLSASERYSFTDTDSIYEFLNVFASYYRETAGLSESEFQDLLSKINQSRSIKAEQRQEIIESLSLSPLDRFLRWLSFNVPAAYASYISTAGGGLCYKDDAPGNPSPGFSCPVVSCNSGEKIIHGHLHFRSDCGPYGTECDIHYGCLNFVCRAFPNAIWDPSTTMCGCG